MKKLINILAKVGVRLTPYQKLKHRIHKKIKDKSIDEIAKLVDEEITKNNINIYDIYRVLFFALKDENIQLSIQYGEKAQQLKPSKELEHYIEKRKKLMHRYLYNIEVLKEILHTRTIEDVEQWMLKAVKYRPELKLSFYKAFFTFYKSQKPLIAIRYGEKAIILGADEKFQKVVKTRERWIADKSDFSNIDLSDLSMKELKNILEEQIEISYDKAVEYIENVKQYDSNLELTLKTHFLKKINKEEFALTVQLGASILDRLEEKSLLKVVAARAYALQDHEMAYRFYHKYFMLSKDKNIIDRYIICIVKYIDISQTNDDIEEIFQSHFHMLKKKNQKEIKNKFYFEFFFLKGDYENAVNYGLDIVRKEKNGIYPIRVARAFFEMGEISQALKRSNLQRDDEKHRKIINLYSSYLFLLENGFSYSLEYAPLKHTEGKVLYVLNNALPYHSNGYATRGHGLLKGVKKVRDIHCITRLGYPHDLAKFRKHTYENLHQVDGIDYYHLSSESEWLNYIPLDDYLIRYGERLYEHVAEHNIGLIHSASNFVNALAANYAARKAGIKSLYEVRGLWEITRISRQPKWENSEHFNMIKRLETQAAKEADVVVAITYALKEELVKRGVAEEKISVLPNGVDSTSFVPLKRDTALLKELNIPVDDTVIGYIGSIVEYEGIDLLVEAIALLKKRNIKNFKFLLVGDGRYFEYIKQLIIKLGVEDLVIVTGRVSHEEVERYYSIIDIAPLPRRAVPVSEMVSPLKPFEAMAMGKVVLGSDVAAIAEIIEENYNGILFEKENVKDLTEKLAHLLKNSDQRKQIGLTAREWVVKERDWSVLAKKLDDLYSTML